MTSSRTINCGVSTDDKTMDRPYVIHEEIDTPHGEEVYSSCSKCRSEVYWENCHDCEYGASHHDCGEDTCCCLDPEPNVMCDTCDGRGGWYQCLSCGWLLPEAEKEVAREVNGDAN